MGACKLTCERGVDFEASTGVTKDTAWREPQADSNSACWEEVGYIQRDTPVPMKSGAVRMIAGP